MSNMLSNIIRCLFLFILIPLQSYALNIELKVQEQAGINRLQSPVTSGVPIPKDENLLTIDTLKLADSTGNIIPTQFRILSRYGGTVDNNLKPIRVVLIDFQSTQNKGEEKTYYLTSDGNGTISGSDWSNILSTSSTHVTFNTGMISADISKTSFNLFDQVFIDTNNDLIPDSKIISSNSTDGLIVRDIVNGTARDFISSFGQVSSMENKENGPLKAVLKVSGDFRNDEKNTILPPGGDSQGASGDTPLKYTVRLYAYKNKPYIKTDITIRNENLGWAINETNPVHNTWIQSIHAQTTFDLEANKNIGFSTLFNDSFSSANYDLSLKHTEASDKDDYNNYFVSIFKDNTTQLNPTNTLYEGQIHLEDNKTGVMVTEKWFWQNWPKSISIDTNQLNYFLWPKTEKEHRLLGGSWKTHTLLYNFYIPLNQNKQFENSSAFLKSPLFAMTSDSWTSKANIMDGLAPKDVFSNYTFPGGEKLQYAIDAFNKSILAKYDSRFITNSNAPETIPSLRQKRPIQYDDGTPLNWFGWLWFGDTPRGTGKWGYSGQHYDWSYVTIANALRFHNYDMFRLGEEFVSHQADLLIVHDPQGDTQGRIYHGGHRYEADALLSFYDTHSASGNNDVARTAHSWNKGLTLWYFLTGEERYRDTLSHMGFHWIQRWINEAQCDVSDCSDQGMIAPLESRNQGRAIHGLVEVHRATGDSYYLQSAYNIFKNAVLTLENNQNGWVDYGNAFSHSICGNDYCDAHVMYNLVVAESLLELHQALSNNNLNNEATEVEKFLIRQATWVNDLLFENWIDENNIDVRPGNYRDNYSEYFPYNSKLYWKENIPWSGINISHQSWSMRWSSVFAFAYKHTKDIAWLNLARNVFKDYFFYPEVVASWQPTASNHNDIEGFYSNPGSAYLKVANDIIAPMYYLNIESRFSRRPTIIDITSD